MNITIDELQDYINSLLEEKQTYDSVIETMAKAALAAAYAVNNSPQGGITGYQASFVMWKFIKEWMYGTNKCGLRLLDYDNFLYPQYEKDYQKTIPLDTWKRIQKEAKNKLKNKPRATLAVRKHWESIVAGKIPFGYTLEG